MVAKGTFKRVFEGRIGWSAPRLAGWVSTALMLGMLSTACNSGAEQETSSPRLYPDKLEPCPGPVLEALDQNDDVAAVFVVYKEGEPRSGACLGKSVKPVEGSVTIPVDQTLPYTNSIIIFETNPHCWMSGGKLKCVN